MFVDEMEQQDNILDFYQDVMLIACEFFKCANPNQEGAMILIRIDPVSLTERWGFCFDQIRPHIRTNKGTVDYL